ncbi:MAG TPA: hypothetical protein VH120_08730 [Gemmataceae bacterium]|jgi:hypothetical protein|nr:hypothetical protein [Gemmataceae bacterium]
MHDQHVAIADDQAGIRADLKAVLDSVINKTPLDPVIARRVRERGERIRKEVYERHGLLNVAVDLIREGRDEE